MDALAALALQIAWGADEALDDAPRDRRVPVAAAQPILAMVAAPAAVPAPASVSIVAPIVAPVARAQALAATATGPAALRTALAGFDGCGLSATATSLVFSAGDAQAGIVLVADAPGAAEDRAGLPFAGEQAAFLDQMLGSIGLSLAGVLATSLLPWRPPGDRKPTEMEVQICLPFLLRHLALLQPRHLLLMGGLTARALLPAAGRRPRGTWHQVSIPGLPAPVPALAFGSPAHIRATPSAKRDAWLDLLRLRRALGPSRIDDPI